MALCKVFLDRDNLDYITVLNSVTLINVKMLQFMAQHTSTQIDNLETITIQGNKVQEVLPLDNTAVDNISNIGLYYINTNNEIVLIVSNNIKTDEQARRYLEGILVRYQTKLIKYTTDDSLYVMKTYNSEGLLVSESNGSNLNILTNKMLVLDDNVDVNYGFFTHVLTRQIEIK